MLATLYLNATSGFTAASNVTDSSHSKKYFSSHERLHIAQQSAAEKRKRKPLKRSWFDSPSQSYSTVDEIPRPRTAGALSTSTRGRAPRLASEQNQFSPSKASWFLDLPDKLKRQQFSREERVLLTERSETAISLSPITAETFNHRELTSKEEATSPLPQRLSSGHSNAVAPPLDLTHDVDPTSEILATPEPCLEHEVEMDRVKSFVRRRSDASHRNSFPPPPAIPRFADLKHQRKKSFRRSFALQPLPLPAPTLAPVPALPSPTVLQQLRQPIEYRRQRTDSNFSHRELAADAKYYQDPETRQKLKAFATPHKFDEAIEFGFPPTELQEPLSPSADNYDLARKFSLTFSSSEDDDSSSSHSPMTPTATSEPAYFRNHSSVNSRASLPVHHVLEFSPKSPGHRRTPSFGNREMTLRMTLTRPDLRAPGPEPVTAQEVRIASPATAQDDPLALEELPVCDDPSGAHGAFAVSDGSHQSKGEKGVDELEAQVTCHVRVACTFVRCFPAYLKISDFLRHLYVYRFERWSVARLEPISDGLFTLLQAWLDA